MIIFFVYLFMKKEIWKSVIGYEGVYEVSSLGRVKSLDRLISNAWGSKSKVKGVYLSTSISSGYLSLGLTKNGKTKTTHIHRLMAVAFIPNTENKRCVNHIDGNKLNNSLDNLEWTTDKENINHAWSIGLHEKTRNSTKKRLKNGIKNFNKSKRVIKSNGTVYSSVVEAAKENNIKYSTLVARLNGRLKNNTGLSYENE